MAQAAASSTLQRSMHATNEWLQDLAQRLDLDSDDAVHVLERCLHEVRDNVTVDEAADLAAQLPMVVRGLYFHEWDPSSTPVGRSRQQALDRLAQHPPFANGDVSPEAAMQAVGSVLASHVTWGEVTDVITQAPSWIGEMLQPSGH